MKRVILLPGAVFAAATIFAGCGAGSSISSSPAPIGSTPTPVSSGTTSTPSQTPTGTPSQRPTQTPTPLVTPAPVQTAVGASPAPGSTAQPGNTSPIYHPADNGDTFTMLGTLLITVQRPIATPEPEPTQTTMDDVTQATTVGNPATFGGNGGAVDFRTVETDQQVAPVPQTFTQTIDDYYSFSNTLYTGNFNNLGYTSKDDSGYGVTYTFGAGNGLADILPETAGATWTNSGAATISIDAVDDQTSTQTFAGNGTYQETINYQNVGATGPTTSATVVANLDGSALYTTPRLGTALGGDYTYAVQAPTADGSAGTITETTTVPVAPDSTATPEVVSTTIPNWIPAGKLGTSLATETDTDMGAGSLPAACPVPAAFGASANKIVQTKELIDPMFGTDDNATTTTYDIANVGPVCVTIADVQTDYYDFTGQNGTGYFSGVPQQITNVAETLYLSAETLSTIARHPAARARAQQTFALRVTTAQNRIRVARLKQRSQLLRAFLYPAPGRGRAFSSHRGIL